MIIDYDVWATSAIAGKEEWPEFPRSAINEQEAQQQADEFVALLKEKTGIADWQGHWKLVQA